MDVRKTDNREEWEDFVRRQPECPFLQSWAWGEFQQAAGRPVIRIAAYQGDALMGVMQGVVRTHGFGIRSLSVFRGPVVSHMTPMAEYAEVLLECTNAMIREAKQQGVSYVHFDPVFEASSPAANMVDRMTRAWKPVRTEQPQQTLLLGLEAGTETLFSSLHQKTRYNINLAERKGVAVHMLQEADAIETFLSLNKVMSKRQRITAHSDAYYRAMAKSLIPVHLLSIWVAMYESTPLAANLVLHLGDTVTYLHGASGNVHRELMAPHLLQWKQIEWAASRDAKLYDFWGVAPKNADASHSWAGITRFKRGFGGTDKIYMQARDLPIRKFQYMLVNLRRRLR